MALVTIDVIRGVFTPTQKKQMIENVSEAMIAVEGEAMRNVIWVRLNEVEHWAVGGFVLEASSVRAQTGTQNKTALLPDTKRDGAHGYDRRVDQD
jgi:4-oxalocrotonate tautomerase